MMYLLSLLMISNTLSIPLSLSPIPLGATILLMALTIMGLTSFLTSSWFSMTIFLVYVGGLMVLFMYFLAVQPNQFIIALPIFTALILNTLLLSIMSPSLTLPLMFLPLHTNFTFIMSSMNYPIIIFLGSILLLIMVVVVKITSRHVGPLRPFANLH